MIFACDLDDVVFDTRPQINAICRRRRRPVPDAASYAMLDGVVLEELALGGYAQARPHRHAVATLIQWMVRWGSERQILFLTARPRSLVINGARIAVHDQTVAHLREIGLGDYLNPKYGYAEVHSIEQCDKVEYLLDFGHDPADITLLDDRGSTCAKAHEYGLRAIVYDQPWNEYLCHGLPRAVGWKGQAGVAGMLDLP